MLKINRKPFAIIAYIPDKTWDKLTRKSNKIGYSFAFFNFIKKSFKDDMDIVTHELVHVEQFYKEPFTQGLKYMLYSKHRLLYEAEAYGKELLFKVSKKYDVSNYNNFEHCTEYIRGLEEATDLLFKYYKLNLKRAVVHNAIKLSIMHALLEYNTNSFYRNKTFWINKKSTNESC